MNRACRPLFYVGVTCLCRPHGGMAIGRHRFRVIAIGDMAADMGQVAIDRWVGRHDDCMAFIARMQVVSHSPMGHQQVARPAMTNSSPNQPSVQDKEAQRLMALRRLRVFGALPDPSLDVITRLAADRFDTQIALISLVEEHKVAIKSSHGMAAGEVTRAESLCAHGIASDGIMVVPDARQDVRFAANPLVLQTPFIRFYAGVPLITSDGQSIGMLAIIDSKPRCTLTAREADALRLMATQAMQILESEHLRREQQISQLIAHTTSDAIVCSDAHSRIIHWNRAAERMFGWRADEVLGKPMHRIIPDRHRHAHDSGMARLRNRGPTRMVGTSVEIPALHRNGREFPVELSLGMWPAEGEGDPEGFAAIIRDIAHRKMQQDERAATEHQLEQHIAAIEASDDGIAVTDAAGNFIFMNRAHATMFGYHTADALIGQPWQVLYDDANARFIGDFAMPTIAEAGRWRGDVQGRRADGSAVEQEVSLSLLADGGLVCVTRDIGDRLGLEREKAHLQEQLLLAQRQEAVGLLTNGIAHDFNNMIAAIAGTASMLERVDDQIVRGHARRIQSAAATAMALVDSLLSAGRRVPDRATIDLRAILPNVHDLVAPGLRHPLHRIDLDLPRAPVLVHADKTEVIQVLVNLALNARDALPQGRPGQIRLSLRDAHGHAPSGEVLVGKLPDGPAALITVQDTGSGIAAENLAAVFEPYFTRKGEAGTGLGLAVVARIVQAAGGAVALASRAGHGALFEIWWPMQPAARPADAWPLDRVVDGGSLAGATILVVDDNQGILDMLVPMFEAEGADPHAFVDPTEALAAVCECPDIWDLVITDHDMPGLNGTALARQLRNIRADLPMILLSALPDFHASHANDTGMFNAILNKPAETALLVAAARAAMAASVTRVS